MHNFILDINYWGVKGLGVQGGRCTTRLWARVQAYSLYVKVALCKSCIMSELRPGFLIFLPHFIATTLGGVGKAVKEIIRLPCIRHDFSIKYTLELLSDGLPGANVVQSRHVSRCW